VEQAPTSQRLPGNVHAFGATSFLNDTATEMAYWVLPAFLVTIGAGPAQLGIIEGIAESAASLAKLLSGYLADRIPRRKPIVVLGYFTANVVKPLLAFVGSWGQVLSIRFVDRIAKGLRGTARDVMVADSVDEKELGSAYGLIQTMDSAGAIAGPLTAVLLLSHYGFRGVFLAAAVPGFLCVLVAVLWIRESPKSAVNRHAAESLSNPTSTRLPGSFYFVLFAVTLFALGNSSDMFLVLRSQDVGISPAQAPLLGLVFNITYTLSSWPAGRLSDRFSRYAIAAAGYMIFAAVYFVFGTAPSTLAIWMAMACYGLFYALTNPVLKALIVEAVPADLRGRALGVYFFSTSIATLLASIITGELWKYSGPRMPFYLSASVAIVSSILLVVSQGAPSRRR
jgi:MFS family permease